MAAWGNWRGLYLLEFPFKLYFEQIRNHSQERGGTCRGHTHTRQPSMRAPVNESMWEDTVVAEGTGRGDRRTVRSLSSLLFPK